MRKLTCLLTVFCSLNAFAQPKLVQKVEKKGDEVVIPFQKYVLDNGLTVILTEDHSTPIVHVDVTYHVGSAREEIGKSGFAHFYEHMMFEGSDHVASGEHFKKISSVGGNLNGSTNSDRTNYFETVPSNQLERILWLESDRMGFLMDAVTQPKFEIQRSTVKNERGQNYDNRPYGLVSQYASQALYPYGHPYSWLTIGYIEDLNRVDVNDLKQFFLRWYGPNNATLTIGGDIDAKQTLAWVQKYFGSIPRCPEVTPTIVPAPVLSGDRYISYTDNYARLPMLNIQYPGAKLYDKDQAALDALAFIIGVGRGSLFYKNFTKTRKAAQASMRSQSAELAGSIVIQIVPYPGSTLGAMKAMVDSTLAEFEQRGVTDDDLARFKGTSEERYINSLGSISGKVSALAAAQTFTGDPAKTIQELQDIRKVTREDVMRVYNQYIKGRGAVILSVLPKSGSYQPVAPDNYTVDTTQYKAPDYGYAGLMYHKATDNFDRSVEPPAGPDPVIKVPAFWKATTANGIQMIGTYSNEIPRVSVRLRIKGGGLWAALDMSKAGLAGITAQMLNDETEHYTAEQFNAELEKLGSNISVTGTPDETIFTMNSLVEHLPATLALLQERLLHPRFTSDALERIRKMTLQSFQIAKTQPATVATNVFNKILYGTGNVRNIGLIGTEKTIPNITLADVQGFYTNYFAPGLTSVTVTGDISQADIRKGLAFLEAWPKKDITPPGADSSTGVFQPNTLYIVDVPRAAQSELRVGYVTKLNYDATGTYFRLLLTNIPLGGGFEGRLNLDLREEKGWTYGASSQFSSDQYGGIFSFATGVRASSTDSALAETMSILADYSANGVKPSELAFIKSSYGQSEALRYETDVQKALFLERIQTYNLSPGFVTDQHHILAGLTASQVDDLAKTWLDPSRMAVLVVGDKERILPGLSRPGITIVELDADGRPK